MPVKKTASQKEEKIMPDSASHNEALQQTLINNSIILQKVMTNLSLKIDGLTDQISKLLDLFEISAKSFAEKDFEGEASTQRKIIEKLDELIAQNKKMQEIKTNLPQTETQQEYPQENQNYEDNYEEDENSQYHQSYRPLPKY